MTIRFIPLGIPVSSSLASRAKYALNVDGGGFPVSAAFAEFSTSSVGPSGSSAITITGTIVSKSGV